VQVTTDAIRALREQSGAGIMDCKRALEETNGDVDKAQDFLREKGVAKAAQKASRETGQGLIEAYVHSGNRIGAIIEVNCETDFVARSPVFRELAHNLAMQVAAMAPVHISQEEVPPEDKRDPKEICLLQQPFIKDPSTLINDLITSIISTTGENIRVRRFTRFALGE
jgi:elongation factor Ts